MSDKRMGEVFAQDQVPLPRYDPRLGAHADRRIFHAINPDRIYDYSTLELARKAGLDDVGKYPMYGPANPGDYPEYGTNIERDQGFQRFPVINRMVNPEQFRDMLSRKQESPNAVWSFEDRFRGM
jgi:hypothetical protein